MPTESADNQEQDTAGGSSSSRPMTPAERARHASLVRWGKEQPFAARLEAVRQRRKAAKAKKGGGKGKAKAKGQKQDRDAVRAENRAKVKQAMADADAGLSPSGSDALTGLADGQQPNSTTGDSMVARGLMEKGEDGQYHLTDAGRSAASAMDRGDYQRTLDAISTGEKRAKAATEKEKAKAEKQGKGGGGGGGSKEKETDEEKAAKQEQAKAENRSKVGAQLNENDADLSQRGLEALSALSKGDAVDEGLAEGLVKLGLAEQAEDGSYRASTLGRQAIRAAERGDYGATIDAVSRAKDRKAKSEKRDAEKQARQKERRQKEDERRAREDERRKKEDEASATKAADPDEVYRRYHETVNMSASELEAWAETDASRRASLDRSPIRRNLRLLRKPKAEWTAADIRDANRTISFVSRMRGAEQGKPVNKDIPYSKRDISLRNWAYAAKHGTHDQPSHGKRGKSLEIDAMTDFTPIIDDLKALCNEAQEIALEDDAEIKAGRRNNSMDQSLIDEGYAMAEELCDLFEALGATVEEEEEDGEMNDMPDDEMMDMENKSINYDQAAQLVRDAWVQQSEKGNSPSSPYPWPQAVFDDGVIVSQDGCLYFVPYRREDGAIAFAPRNEWRMARQTYITQDGDVKAQRTFGGKDREDVPDESFAGPNRTFPVMTAQDVRDAARLIGKADDPESVKRRIIAIAKRKGFTDAIPEGWEVKKDIDIETLLGGAVKMADDDSILGPAVWLNGTPDTPDLSHMRDYFTKSTDFWLSEWERRPMLWHHAMDESDILNVMRREGAGDEEIKAMREALAYLDEHPVIGTWTKATVDPIAVWLKGQINKAHRYRGAIKQLVDAGLIKISTDSASHLVKRERQRNGTNEVKRWPIIAGSLTATAAEPRLFDVQAVKSLYDAAGVPLPFAIDPVAQEEGDDGQGTTKVLGDQQRKLMLELDLLELEMT